MAKFIKNVSQLLSKKEMFAAYLRWLSSVTFQNKPPELKINDKVSIGEWISFSEYWSFRNVLSEAEKDFILKNLSLESEQKKVAFDIGANIGLFTAYLTTFASTSVHSFEPVPQTFSRLEKNMKNNGLKDKAVLNRLAVGDTQGSIKFAISDDSPATNKISTSESDHDMEVIVTTLDQYCEDNHIDYIDFLKIDVEGMEAQVLRGGYRYVKREKS
jgi:FkbM family methyltransferase